MASSTESSRSIPSGMIETIQRFPEQFGWEPEVAHNESLRAHSDFVVCGMGGSQLGSMLIQAFGPMHNLTIHKDYGLPPLSTEAAEQALFIMSSYSGTTEETLDSAREALAKGYAIAAISTGGRLIDFAREHALPHIVIPDTGLQPRLATGYSMLGLSRLMSNTKLETGIRAAGKALSPMSYQEGGQRIAEVLRNRVALFYTSTQNAPLGYIWKIKLNETGKVPAFCNMVPEMCHNELCGMDVADSTASISKNMQAVFLEDERDHERNKKRMHIAGEMLDERGIPVLRIPLAGEGFGKAFATALLADWVSYYLAQYYKVPDEATPLIADFKKKMS